MNNLPFIKAAGAALVLGFATFTFIKPAHAGEDHFVFTYKVADLDNPDTAVRVYRRLVRNAGQFCNDGVSRASHMMYRVWRECRSAIITDVVEKISDSRLSRLHASKHAKSTNVSSRQDIIATCREPRRKVRANGPPKYRVTRRRSDACAEKSTKSTDPETCPQNAGTPPAPPKYRRQHRRSSDCTVT